MNISTRDVYYIYMELQGERTLDQANPIAEGISVFQETEEDNLQIWGFTSWFDKIAGNMCTVEISKAPEVEGRNIKVYLKSGAAFVFEYVTVEVFNKNLRPLFQVEVPSFDKDEAVQEYIHRLNPYE